MGLYKFFLALNTKYFNISGAKIWDVAKLMSLDLTGKIMPFLLLPVYLKIMTQEEFGQYSLLFQISIYAAGILTIGLENSWGKFFYEPERINEKGKMIGTSFSLSFIMLGLFTAILFLLRQFFLKADLTRVFGIPLDSISFLLLVPAIYAAAATQLSQNFFMLLEKPKIFLRLNFLKVLLGCLFFFLLYKYFSNRAYFRFIIEGSMVFLIILPFTIYQLRKLKFGISRPYAELLLKTSFPFFINTLAGIFYLLGDKFLVQKELGNEILAIYNLCLYLIMPLGFFMVSFNQVWLPGFYKEGDLQKNIASIQSVIKKLSLLFTIGGLAIWFGLFITLKTGIINESYAYTLWIFPLVFIGRLMDTLSSIFIGFFLKSNLMWQYMALQLVLGLLIVLLNILFINSFGLISVVVIAAIIGILRFLLIKKFIFLRHLKKVNLSENTPTTQA